jgi:hypothetical protein
MAAGSLALAHSIFSLSSLSVPLVSRMRLANNNSSIDPAVRNRGRRCSYGEYRPTTALSHQRRSMATISTLIGSSSTSLAPYQSPFAHDLDSIDGGM